MLSSSSSSAQKKMRKKKYKLTVSINKLEGVKPPVPPLSTSRLPSQGAKAAEIRWKLSAVGSSRGLLSLSGYLPGSRKKPSQGLSRREAVSDRGVVRWDAADEANRFERVCRLGDVVSKEGSDHSSGLDLSLSILYGSSSNDRGRVRMDEIGSTIVRVSDWIKELQSEKRSQGVEVEGLKKQLPVETRIGRSTSYAVLHVTVSFLEETASRDSKKASKGEADLVEHEHTPGSQQRQIDELHQSKQPTSRDEADRAPTSEYVSLEKLLQLQSDGKDDLTNRTNRSSTEAGAGTSRSSGMSNPQPGTTSSSRHQFGLRMESSKVSGISNIRKEEASAGTSSSSAISNPEPGTSSGHQFGHRMESSKVSGIADDLKGKRALTASPEKMRKKKYKLTVSIDKLEGLMLPPLSTSRLPSQGAKAAEIRWKLSAVGSGLRDYLSGSRNKPLQGVSSREAVSDRGVVRWDAADEANRFEGVCRLGDDVVSKEGSDHSSALDLSLSILYGSSSNERGRVDMLGEIARTVVRVSDWIKELQSENRSQGVEVEGLKKQLPVETRIGGLTSYVVLHVTVSFLEETASKDSKKASKGEADLVEHEHTPGSQRRIDELRHSKQPTRTDEADRAPTSEYYVSLENLLQLFQSDGKDDLTNRTTQSSTEAGPGTSSSSSKVSGIANDPKGKRALTASTPKEEDNPNGSWRMQEFISSDRKTKLRVNTFFASIDQRDPSARGGSACAPIVAVIAHAIHTGRLNLDSPSRSEFDSLIKKGSREWRKLCEATSNVRPFRPMHFEMDTVIKAKVSPISIDRAKSFVGFFQPERFMPLRGAMPFDDIWLQITNDVGILRGDPQIYIVGWHAHFFILKLQSSAYYVLDTLGRIYHRHNKAYILRFDDSTAIYEVEYSRDAKREAAETIICRGKGCCKEYFNRFLAATLLREELELANKKTGPSSSLHDRLQIDFYLTLSGDK